MIMMMMMMIIMIIIKNNNDDEKNKYCYNTYVFDVGSKAEGHTPWVGSYALYTQVQKNVTKIVQ